MNKMLDRLRYLFETCKKSVNGEEHILSPLYLIIDYITRVYFNIDNGLQRKLNMNFRAKNYLKQLDKIDPSFVFESDCGDNYQECLIKYIDARYKREAVYDFEGILIPHIPYKYNNSFSVVFFEVFVPFLFFDNRFSPELHKKYPRVYYGYDSDDFKVVVESGDVVIDAGSWIGDFAAYASRCGATVHAFEPTPEVYSILCKTAELNSNINAINMGLGEQRNKLTFNANEGSGTSNRFLENAVDDEKLQIEVTTVDDYVEMHEIKVDFIKADIEGYERKMLSGAIKTLRAQAPKLAICTYHLKDDPQVLEKIILKANPRYKILQMPQILFAVIEDSL